jgi:TonB-linked SusC/RagA family outer membrane protein
MTVGINGHYPEQSPLKSKSMTKFSHVGWLPYGKKTRELVRIMKLTFWGVFLLTMQVSAKVYSQGGQFSFQRREVKLNKAFNLIERKSDYRFFYNNKEIAVNAPVMLSAKNADIRQVLDSLLIGMDLHYRILQNKVIMIVPAGNEVQAIHVNGMVTDSTGGPLVGVSVQIKGTSRGTVTDSKGHYEIEAPTESTLVFSYVGYQNKEISINGRKTVNVTLSVAHTGLNEVVVMGYTTESKHKLTSAVSTVSGTALNRRVATNPVNLLQGQLPGLQITQNSGQPGSESNQLLVRGVSTFSGAGNSPLVIVDGLPGSLSNLNPNDIESITVLKDAASAAIYGSRGANGVIVVTTKKGHKGGGFSVEYGYNVGITNATKLPDVVTNSATYMKLYNEARTNSGLQPIYTQQQIDLYKNATDRVKYPNFNWLNAIFKTAYVQNHYVNMSGGNDKTNYSVGLGITNQPGVMIGFKYNKYTLDFGLRSKISDRVTFGADIDMKYSKQSYPEDGAGDFFLSALAQAPTYRPQMNNGLWVYKAYQNELNNKNPVALVGNNIITYVNDHYLQGNLSLNVKIIDGLQWENKVGVNYDATDDNDFRPVIPLYYYSDTSFGSNLDDGSPGLYVSSSTDRHIVGYSQFTFDRQFGDNHVSALAGYQLEHDHSYYMDASRQGAFPTSLLRQLNAGPDDNPNNDGDAADWAIRSYYGNVHYDYKDKYLVGASLRYDGTSRLPANSRWGLFYSFSGGWRLSGEAFLKNTSWINDLKIRGSWGRLGNQNIGTYPYQEVLNERDYAFGGNVETGFAANGLVDPSLTWETTQVTDIGLDFTGFNGTLSFTADWFSKYTFDILRGSQVPLWLGLNAPTINNGAVRNRGLELALQYKNKIGQNFSYYVGGNFQDFRNVLVNFGQREISSNTIMQQGYPMNTYYMYVWDGIFQSQAEINKSPKQPVTPTPGDLKFKDVNGDGVISDSDRTYVPGVYPKFQYSFNLGGSYRNFDLNVQLYGSYGQKIYVTGWGIEPFRQGSVPTTAWLNAWTPQNQSNTMPKIYDADSYPAVQNYPSTYFLKNGSFMRIKNLEIGYTLPVSLTKRVKIESVRLYFDADNLITFSKFPGIDPERVPGMGTGARYVNYPQNKVYSFGASVKF